MEWEACYHPTSPATSPVTVAGSIARGADKLNCTTHGSRQPRVVQFSLFMPCTMGRTAGTGQGPDQIPRVRGPRDGFVTSVVKAIRGVAANVGCTAPPSPIHRNSHYAKRRCEFSAVHFSFPKNRQTNWFHGVGPRILQRSAGELVYAPHGSC